MKPQHQLAWQVHWAFFLRSLGRCQEPISAPLEHFHDFVEGLAGEQWSGACFQSSAAALAAAVAGAVACVNHCPGCCTATYSTIEFQAKVQNSESSTTRHAWLR